MKQLPKGEKVLMRTYPTCTYYPPILILSVWVINYWLVDAKTHVLSPMITTYVGVLKPNLVTTSLETNAAIEATNKHLSTTTALVIMDSYAPKALMRFTP
jgi:hypothetical protein